MKIRARFAGHRAVRAGGVVAALVLVAGLLSGCNLAPDVALGGTVTTTSGAKVGQVTVTVFSGPSTQVAQATTDGSGDYEIKDTDLAAGTYRVRVGDEWYGPGATDYASAAPVTVTAGSPTRLDLTVSDAADVTGTVVDVNHDPAPGTLVAAYDASSQIVTLAVTAADGTFDLGVPAGATITVKVADSAHPLASLGGVTPTEITTIAGSNDIGTLTIVDTTQIAAGDYHTCALEADHTVECWGNNSSGQLGNGTTTDSDVPVPVVGPGRCDRDQHQLQPHVCAQSRSHGRLLGLQR